ncbi:MAG: cytochrome P450 [Pseudomonadota bacterium]
MAYDAPTHSLKRPLATDIAGISARPDPFPALAELRAAGPVVPARVPFVGRAWTTTSHAAAEAVLKGKDQFVSEGRNAGVPGIERVLWWMPRSLKVLADNMLLKDEPDHRRLRTLVNHAFARRGILEMRGDVTALADRLIDGFGSGPVDLVEAYARQLPLDVICELLGLPDSDRPQFIGWARSIGQISGPLGVLRMMGSLSRFVRYIREQIESSRHSPRPGLIAPLVEAEEDGDRLTEDEMVAMVATLLVAGFETTTHLIAGSVYALETHPEQKAWLLADPEARIEQAVEELLRFWTPVQSTKQRFVAQDCVLDGQPLARGDLIFAHLGAANADPAVFDAPETLQLDRFPNPHLAFGSGIHFCLGLQLARLEAQVAITRLYARHPGLTLRQPASGDWLKRYGLRGFKALHIDLG